MTEQTEKPFVLDTPAPAPASTPAPATLSSKLIESVPVELEAFLGGARMTVAQLAALKPGAAVALDAQLNGAVELRMNGVAVARGELVAVGEKFGVRLTEIAQWPD
ncbi:MAG: FliM/FliN family flagellar motor switch protein [Pseudomonadota bacterium]